MFGRKKGFTDPAVLTISQKLDTLLNNEYADFVENSYNTNYVNQCKISNKGENMLIKELMKKRNINEIELAEKTGISHKYLKDILRGKKSGIVTLARIAKILDVNIGTLTQTDKNKKDVCTAATEQTPKTRNH